MKLLRKINRSYLRYGILVIGLADILIVICVNFVLRSEIDQELELEVLKIQEYISREGYYPSIEPITTVEQVSSKVVFEPFFRTQMVYDDLQKLEAPFREYNQLIDVNNVRYKVTVRRMMIELHDFVGILAVVITFIMLLVFVGVLYFTNRYNLALFKTFNNNLKATKGYSFNSPKQLALEKCNIDEFDEFSEVIVKMTKRLEDDYNNMKEFSVNAAHEIQTPLAIIQSKCEHLIALGGLEGNVLKSVHEIFLSSNRLSGITKALLLLAKIENGQFNNLTDEDVASVFREWIESFEEVILDKQLQVVLSEEEQCVMYIDRRLLGMLVKNMLVNAIRNTKRGKSIQITLTKSFFSISNSGDQEIKNSKKIFERFYREQESGESTGIGLAIVKKIVDNSDIEIDYAYRNKMHTFTFFKNRC